MPRIVKKRVNVAFAHANNLVPAGGPLHFEFPHVPAQIQQGIAPLAALSQQGLHNITTNVFNALGQLSEKLQPAGSHVSVSVTPSISASPATRLKAALAGSASDSLSVRNILGIIQLGGLLGAAGNLLSPTGPGSCDHNPFERCCNCATSVPYIMVGAHAIKHRRTTAGKVWGASMCAVGTCSIGFHASSGKLRSWGRRFDYWSIAAASNMMVRSVFPGVPAPVTAAGLALTPFKPFLVSFLNSAAMELKFLERAHKNPELRKSQRLHAATCLLGLSAFALEEFMPEMPLIHSAWHCLSATAVASVNNLLDDVERHNLRITDA